MAEEKEIIRCLEQMHRTSTEASFTSPLIAIIDHDVYSSNPDNLPLQSDGMEETQKKKYYCTPLKHRGAAAAGIARVTPDGRWKARDGPTAIMSNEWGEIRYREPRTPINEIMAMEAEGFTTTIGFKKKFEYIKGGSPGQKTKWAMIEYTLHPPESGQENRYALCYVYKTKQDGRQRNGNGRVNEQQPTNHYVGGSSTSASAIAVEGSSPFELFEIQEEFQFETPGEFQFEITEEFQFEPPEELDAILNEPLWSWNI